MKIGIVVNPRSRRNLRDPSAAGRLEKRLGARGLLRRAHSKDELYAIAAEFLAAGIDVLAIGGGDGTNHVTLTGFLDVYGSRALPPIALLRGGTMNTVANACHVPKGSPDELLERLLSVPNVRDLRTTERHVMKVGQDYGFLFGVGVVHGFMAEYYKDGRADPAGRRRDLAARHRQYDCPGRDHPSHRQAVSRQGRIPRRRARRVAPSRLPRHRRPARSIRSVSASVHLDAPANAASMARARSTCSASTPRRPASFASFRACAWANRSRRTRSSTPSRRAPRLVQDGPVDGELAYMIDGDLHSTNGPLDLSIGPRLRVVIA